MKLRQIPIDERVEGIEKFLIFISLSIASYIAITENRIDIFGKYYIIFNLIVFLISFPLSFYYLSRMVFFVTGRIGESINSFIEKYKSKLIYLFFLSLILIGFLMMYLLGKELKDIIYAIIYIIILAIINKVFLEPYFKKIEF
ncbi:MAG: hypothetical protein OIN86_04755 [Candidatus Methanoperedens sp.]|nr:hypothetical protein [Candidatus Methanoperedens sp.]CAG0997069.1 hypothetical protein METP1_02636 [Methanosarcinales archaeon]